MNNISGSQKLFTFLVLVGIFLMAACSPAAPAHNTAEGALEAEIHYTLKTGAADGQLIFIGVGGEIDGQINPDLTANVGDTVAITLINDDGRFHDFVIDEFNAATSVFSEIGQEETIQFTVDQAGTFFYYCSVTGHRQAGMEGQLIVNN
ncbi:MAG TPA: cupredoxin domain-containing protein [Brevefilum sp.]|nr:cupredoxin domain-containing protein [Brevefilum sp.]HOR18784.1 cupredoxin domain-containing protein [Brevefilum sp.]HPL68685.1 cupredoxin domain-containing protein [Brevefilum sp.]